MEWCTSLYKILYYVTFLRDTEHSLPRHQARQQIGDPDYNYSAAFVHITHAKT